jgi:putative colanic acid biosynthesis acetyltransferase WcaB
MTTSQTPMTSPEFDARSEIFHQRPTRNPLKIVGEMCQYLGTDYRQNRVRVRETGGGSNRNLKGLAIVTCFRIAQAGQRLGRIPLLGIVFKLLLVLPYRILFEFLLGIEIPPSVEIGPGLVIFHGQGIVIHNRAKIGCNCMLRHGITIGTSLSRVRADGNPCVPTIGNDCNIGVGAIVIGDITIGDRASIGAGTVVTKSIPADGVMVGSAARLIIPRTEQ